LSGRLKAVPTVITSVIMTAVGVLACAAPARRALRIQPPEALEVKAMHTLAASLERTPSTSSGV
jgi:hypothetical protein